jgi:hypothetical protein
MRNLLARCDPPSPTNPAGISGNFGPCLIPSACSCARPSASLAAPRYRALYRAWQRDGDRVLHATTSPILADTVARRNGPLDCHIPAHLYLHLSPLVGTA